MMTATEYLPTIVTAGNGRRQKTVELSLQQSVDVSTFDDKCEEALGDVSAIAALKTFLAAENWITAHPDAHDQEAYLLGADVMPYVRVPHETASVALRKPPQESLDASIAKNFQHLLESRPDDQAYCSYRLRSSTSVSHIADRQVDWQQSYGLESQIALDPAFVAHYTTPQGVTEYQAAFADFNEHFPLHKVAGGFCVEVLIAEGAVRELDGVDLYTAPQENVREAIHGTIYTAISTVSPVALARMAQYAGQTEIDAETVYNRAWEMPFITQLAEKTFQTFWQYRQSLQQVEATMALALADQWQMPTLR